MADHKLVLHPVNPRAILQDPEHLMESLRGVGLAGGGFSHVGELHYKAGPRFRELVVFKEGAAPADPAQLHLSVVETTTVPRFLGGSNAQGPACPNCQTRFSDWKAQLLTWQSETRPPLSACGRCGTRRPFDALDWGTTGGVARYSLDVWGVPENAATPSPELLSALESEVQEPWRYFYYRF
jgi:hypothetical protein